MPAPIDEVPEWIKQGLQGLAYWVGFRKISDRRDKLGESLAQVKLRQLFDGSLRHRLSVRREILYRSVCPAAYPSNHKERMDIAVRYRGNSHDGTRRLQTRYAFEIKLAGAANARIDSDLLRLAELKRAKPSCRTFLVVIAEGHIPKRFLLATGRLRKKRESIGSTQAEYSTVAAFRAAPYGTPDDAHYVCLIEVTLDER